MVHIHLRISSRIQGSGVVVALSPAVDCSSRTETLILSSTNNAHTWWKRFCWNLGMPAGLLLCRNILETFLATEQNVVIWDASIALSYGGAHSALTVPR
jgi:hypothetical protein